MRTQARWAAGLLAAATAAEAQQVLVRMPSGAPPPARAARWHAGEFGDAVLARALGLDRWYALDSGAPVPERAEIAERDIPGGPAAGPFPDDPLFARQWPLRQRNRVDVDAVAAWRLAAELGGPATPAALFILDSELLTGFIPAPFGPDLPIEAFWNVLTGTPVHGGVHPCFHAAHVASIAAGRGNNALGMAGVSWDARITAVQVLDSCSGTQAQLAAAVVYAADHGARVANMSLQYGDTPIALLEAACAYADGRGVLLVAASGNSSWTGALAVPAMLPTVVGVGAIAANGVRPSWSNAGGDLELCAPGAKVLGMTPQGHAEWDGTSMASPHVAGAACLILGVYPSLDNARVRQVLNESATDVGVPGRDPLYGFGRVNAYRALLAADPCYADFNRDRVLAISDFGAFVSSFGQGQHRANCTGDLTPDDAPVLNIADFACFQAAWTAGCGATRPSAAASGEVRRTLKGRLDARSVRQLVQPSHRPLP